MYRGCLPAAGRDGGQLRAGGHERGQTRAEKGPAVAPRAAPRNETARFMPRAVLNCAGLGALSRAARGQSPKRRARPAAARGSSVPERRGRRGHKASAHGRGHAVPGDDDAPGKRGFSADARFIAPRASLRRAQFSGAQDWRGPKKSRAPCGSRALFDPCASASCSCELGPLRSLKCLPFIFAAFPAI